MRVRFRSAAGQQIENGHAHCDPVGDLFEHTGLRPVGDLRGNLDAAVDRTGMEDDGVPVGAAQPLVVELVEKDVIAGGKRRIVQPFGLHAQHDDDMRSFQGLFDPVDAANRRAGRNLLEFTRNPHGRPA